MEQIEYTPADNGGHVVYDIGEEPIDMVAFGMITGNQIAGFAPVELIEDGEKRQLIYSVSDAIPVSRFAVDRMKEQFLTMVIRNIAYILIAAEDYLIEEDEILFDPDYVFYSRKDNQILLLCVPVSSRDEGDSFKEFCQAMLDAADRNRSRTSVRKISSVLEREGLTLSSVIREMDAIDNEMKIHDSSRKREVVSLGRKKVLLKSDRVSDGRQSRTDAGKTFVQEKNHKVTLRHAAAGSVSQTNRADAGHMAGEPEIVHQYDYASDSMYDTVVLSESQTGSGSGWRTHSEGHADANDVRKAYRPETRLLAESEPETEDIGPGTQLLAGKDQKYTKWEIVRVSTGEKHLIDRDEYRIGKQEMDADFCVKGNPTISRRHAVITCEPDVCYLTDLNSMNHSFINEQMLAPGQKYPLHDGDIFVLSNEAFRIHKV